MMSNWQRVAVLAGTLVLATAGYAASGAAAPPELPTLFHVLGSIGIGDGRTFGDTAVGHFLHDYQKSIFMLALSGLMVLFFKKSVKMRADKPGKVQAVVEMLVEGIVNFFTGIVGKENVRHVPFLASLFLFIWICNLMAAVPLLGPPTAKYSTTGPLAVMAFIYVTFYGIFQGGFGHYLWHMAGSPNTFVGWLLAPFIFFLEGIIGNLAKPLSLGLRLFGNIFGEDVMLGVFLILGIMMAGVFTADPIIGIPLHFPFLFMVLITSTIQALVFSLLSAIYLAMLLPHHEEHEAEHLEHHDPVAGDEPRPVVAAP